MRPVVLLTGVIACMVPTLPAGALAFIPDPALCTVSDCMINTCPVVHPPTAASGSERYCDLTVTLYDQYGNPIAGYPATDFAFTVLPHSAYPYLGGGPSGDWPGCENHYSVTCLAGATGPGGAMPIRVDLGEGCAPSMCCPVEVWVSLPVGTIVDPGEVLQNTVDMVTAAPSGGYVNLSDIAAFSVALTIWFQYGIPQECADFVWSTDQTVWGELTLSDMAMFAQHITHYCEPFTDPRP